MKLVFILGVFAVVLVALYILHREDGVSEYDAQGGPPSDELSSGNQAE